MLPLPFHCSEDTGTQPRSCPLARKRAGELLRVFYPSVETAIWGVITFYCGVTGTFQRWQYGTGPLHPCILPLTLLVHRIAFRSASVQCCAERDSFVQLLAVACVQCLLKARYPLSQSEKRGQDLPPFALNVCSECASGSHSVLPCVVSSAVRFANSSIDLSAALTASEF